MSFAHLLEPREPTLTGKRRVVTPMSSAERAATEAERAIARVKQREAVIRRWARVKGK